MLILKTLKKSYEVKWIYNRNGSHFFLIEDAKSEISEGEKITLMAFGPNLVKSIDTEVLKTIENTINNNVQVQLSTSDDLSIYKVNL